MNIFYYEEKKDHFKYRHSLYDENYQNKLANV